MPVHIRVKTRVACFVHARHAVQADAAGVGENQPVPDNQNALLSIGNPAVIGADHLCSLWNQHETASRGVIYIFSHARARLSWKIGIQPAFERGGNDPAGLDLERRHRVLLFGSTLFERRNCSLCSCWLGSVSCNTEAASNGKAGFWAARAACAAASSAAAIRSDCARLNGFRSEDSRRASTFEADAPLCPARISKAARIALCWRWSSFRRARLRLPGGFSNSMPGGSGAIRGCFCGGSLDEAVEEGAFCAAGSPPKDACPNIFSNAGLAGATVFPAERSEPPGRFESTECAF